MVFGDVTEMIRDTAPDVEIGIVFQRFQNFQRWTRIFHEPGNALSPRKSRTGPFGTESSHMGLGIACPSHQARESTFGPANEKWANGKLRAESSRQFILRTHGCFEWIA